MATVDRQLNRQDGTPEFKGVFASLVLNDMNNTKHLQINSERSSGQVTQRLSEGESEPNSSILRNQSLGFAKAPEISLYRIEERNTPIQTIE